MKDLFSFIEIECLDALEVFGVASGVLVFEHLHERFGRVVNERGHLREERKILFLFGNQAKAH
jgi:hypothetical protein